ncbi:MAG TPA: alpha/beta hydrolase, partial [Nitrolancea sp.]
AILFRPMVPFEPSQAPDLTGTPIFISAARRDELIAPEQSEHLAALFERYGAQVTLVWQSSGHGLTSADVDAARAWLVTQRLASPR